MRALDTNVLVRFLVADDPKQAVAARELVEHLEGEDRAYVSDIVLCELVWVLTRSYGIDRSRVAEVVKQLVASRQLRFDAVDNVIRAVAAFENGKADFADYLIREHAKAAGCRSVMTFDRALLNEEMFTSP